MSFLLALWLASAGSAPEPLTARVVEVSHRRVFLDRGAADGVALGDALSTTGRRPRTCVVEAVAEHRAACAGRGLRPGNRLTLLRPPADTTLPARPPLAGAGELESARAAIATAPYARVETSATARRELGATVRLRQEVVTVPAVATSTAGRQSVDVRLLHAPLPVFDLFASAQLTATRWQWRSAAPRLSPNRDRSELYLWEAAVSRRNAEGGLTAAIGRISPWHTPGIAALDGVQLGYCAERCRLEAGAFAGGVPDPLTAAVDSSRWAAGAYGRLEYQVGSYYLYDATRLTLLTLDGRLRRYEAETALGLEGRRFNVALGSRIGLDVDGSLDQAALDAVQLDFGARPRDALRITGGGRWQRADAAWQDGLDLDPLRVKEAARGDLGVFWDVRRGLSLGATSGVVRDESLGEAQIYVGPEVGLPTLFAARGGLAVGYQRELGLYPGETAYAQLTLRPLPRTVLWLRPFWERLVGGAATGEAGLGARLDVGLSDWLSLRVSALARHNGIDPGPGADSLFGLWANASLTGSF